MTYLSKKQVDLLLQPIHPNRVLERDGMSYVEAYDIRAELNRVFGFGRWSTDILGQELLCETAVQMRNKKDGWYVAYKTSLRLTVQAPDGSGLCHYEESHVGDSTHPVRGEAHGNALTNSHSYALKRCAHNLGDQFGLSLYNKGSLGQVVRWTLVTAPEDGRPTAVNTDDVPQVTAEQPTEAPSSEAPPDAPAAEPDDGDWGDWADVIRQIATKEDADKADADLREVFKGGQIGPDKAKHIREAIREKAASLPAEPELDMVAQRYAGEAQAAADTTALRKVHQDAMKAGKLPVFVSLEDGYKGTLLTFITGRKAKLEEAASSNGKAGART